MIFRNHKAVLSVLVATALTGAVVTDAFAQSSRSSERGNRGGKQAKAEALYPNATRQEPTVKASAKLGSKLQKMIDSYNKEKFPETRTQADAILADSAANEYDKSLAAQLASQAAYQTDDTPAAIAYLKQVLQFNGLDNNGHFQSMLMLGQLQLQEDQTAEGLATLDKYFAEQVDQAGRADRQGPGAVPAGALPGSDPGAEAGHRRCHGTEGQLEPAADGGPRRSRPVRRSGEGSRGSGRQEPERQEGPAESGQHVHAGRPDGKSAAVMDKLRSSGSPKSAYKQLYSIYANTEHKEKDVIAVINEGLQKGILKPDYQVYLALAQSYYYSDQVPQAIDAWQKAAAVQGR